MSMDDKSLLRIAKLARLRLDENDLKKLPGEFDHIMAMIGRLSEVDTDGTPANVDLGVSQMPMQADIISDGGKVDQVMANAPDALYHMFGVPKVVE